MKYFSYRWISSFWIDQKLVSFVQEKIHCPHKLEVGKIHSRQEVGVFWIRVQLQRIERTSIFQQMLVFRVHRSEPNSEVRLLKFISIFKINFGDTFILGKAFIFCFASSETALYFSFSGLYSWYFSGNERKKFSIWILSVISSFFRKLVMVLGLSKNVLKLFVLTFGKPFLSIS